MSANTKIEWADHTFNPWIGCTKVGPGCDNCYAKADFDDRKHRVTWGAGQARSRTKTWGDPVRWNKQHLSFGIKHGRKQRVFCASLADVFDNEIDPQWLGDLFELIQRTPNLDWLLLTKRPGNWKTRMQAVLDSFSLRMPPTPKPRSVTDEEADAMNWVDAWMRNDVIPTNVWLGATIVNQTEADRDIPKLLSIPAAKRFLSMEPLLGPVDLGLQCENWSDDIVMDPETGAYECCKACDYTGVGNDIDWVIVGGESGPNARPMHPDWVRSLRDQCQAAGVPFLFKQWGNYVPHIWFDGPDSETDDCFDDFLDLERVRHHFLAADGRTWDTFGGQLMYPPMPLGNWCLMADVGKKAAGRLLDGREWNGVPS